MAKVEMDLAELDKIRQNLIEAKAEIVLKEGIIKEKDEEIVKVQADKRTIKTTIYEYPKSYIHNYSNYNDIAMDIVGNVAMYTSGRSVYNSGNKLAGEYVLGKLMSLNQTLIGQESKTKTEYVNFDDVLVQIRDEAEKKVLDDLNQKKYQIAQLTEKLGDAKTDKQQALDSQDKLHKADIKVKNEEMETLVQELMDLKENKERISLEDKVLRLEKALEVETNKKWYNKIFN
jgi:hypothetical protein